MAKSWSSIRLWFPIFLLVNAALGGCGQLALASHSPTRLNCILLGNDSIACYYGSAFHAGSLQEFLAETSSPMRLALPKDDGSNQTAVIEGPLASRLVVLIFGDSGIYAYMGNDITAGKQYTYPQFRKFLASKKKDASLVVIIRPSSSASYRCNVHMLDEMTIAGIKKYQLVDITKPEEDFLSRLKKNA